MSVGEWLTRLTAAMAIMSLVAGPALAQSGGGGGGGGSGGSGGASSGGASGSTGSRGGAGPSTTSPGATSPTPGAAAPGIAPTTPRTGTDAARGNNRQPVPSIGNAEPSSPAADQTKRGATTNRPDTNSLNRQRDPNAIVGGGGGTSRTGDRQGGDGNTMKSCMDIWEPATHMTREEWRQSCRRLGARE